jgi:acylphosphatase|tara:strand:- start:113 stop:397 length:285 start_codon:yes stop_codon:yes gene_type:complete
MIEKCLVAVISGRVQGVGYRAFAADVAMRASLQGTARNMIDGRVEVIAEGSENQLRSFLEELRIGPTLSRVDNIESRWDDPIRDFTGLGFEILY